MKKRSAEYSLDEAGRYDSEDTLKEHSAPENHWIQQELGQAIQNAVNSLPEELKTAITLREVAGLSYHEIAEMMQCPLGTVRSRIFRARELIDAKLKDDPL